MRCLSGSVAKLREISILKVYTGNRRHVVYASTDAKEETPANLIDEEEDVEPVNTNRSRLLPQHSNMVWDKRPYDEPQSWIHLTEKYQRSQFGRYGLGSGVDPRICFPTKEDVQERKEYERVAFPHTLAEMIEINRKAKQAKQDAIQKREDGIAKKLEKLEQWKKELTDKISKRESEALAAKERKERLIEEVRRHFGFKVDPRDDRFKEMLEQKEKEDKKKQKEAKRKAKEDKMMAKMVETVKGSTDAEKEPK